MPNQTPDTAHEITIGQLAAQADTKVQTIRYYEQINLMPKPRRTAGNQRRYSEGNLHRLQFIRHGRELGFPLDSIRDLLDLADNPVQPCEDADHLARIHLEEVESRIRRLESLRGELRRMIQECPGDAVGNCRIIEVVSDHKLCTQHGGEKPRQP